MKNFIFFFVFFVQMYFVQSKQLMSQYEAKYIVNFYRDTADINTRREEVVLLLIGDKVSLFKSTQKAIADSLGLEMVRKAMENSNGGKPILYPSKIPEAKFRPEVYNNGKLYVYNEILTTGYGYEMDDKINWKIEQETKVISTYKCRKATGKYKNRNYIAWFAEEIPFSEGPYVFKGLPGLIVEIYDTKDYYHFILGGFNKVSKPIVPNNFHIKTDYDKFVKARNNFLEDPIGIINNSSALTRMNYKIPKKNEESIIRAHRSNNNFLD